MIIKNHGKVLLATFIFIIFTSISAYSFGVTLGVNNGEKKAIEKIKEEEIIKKEKDAKSHITDNKNKNENANKKNTVNNNKKINKSSSRKKIARKKPNKKRSSSSNGASSNKQSPSNPKNIKIPSTLKNGTYYGQAQGFAGIVKVKVVVSGGSIYDVSVVSHSETPEYFQKGVAVINSILSAKSPEVDSISGATYTSNAIKAAVADALKNAGGSTRSHYKSKSSSINELNELNALVDKLKSENDKLKNKDIAELNKKIEELEKNNSKNITGYRDGKYTGSASGYKGDINLTVNIHSGKIESIDINQPYNEDSSYNKGDTIVKIDPNIIFSRIIEKQNADVDIISGATYTSRGLKSAVRDALKNAAINSNNDSDIDKEKLNESNERIKALTEENTTLKNSLKILQKKYNKLEKKIKELLESTTGKSDKNDKDSSKKNNKDKDDKDDKDKKVELNGSETGEDNTQSKSFTNYTIKLRVVMKKNKIELVEDNGTDVETAANKGFWEPIKENYLNKFIGKTYEEIDDVDVISGSTYSSKSVKKSIKQAIEKLKVKSSKTTKKNK